MIRAVVDSMIRVPELHPKVVELLRRRLTFPNPEYVNRVRMKRWVGATPEEICLVEEHRDGTVYLPRGAVGMLRDAAAAVGETVSFRDNRTVRARVTFEKCPTLREYQEQAASALATHLQGYAQMPCGGGKTRVAVAVIGRVGQPAIVLVHTHDLLEQWCNAVSDGLEVEAGTISEGVVSPQVVTIAMVQTLLTMDRSDLEQLGRRFGTVVADECHHIPSATFRNVLSGMAGRYRFGLTATPTRADGLTPLLDLCIGPCLYRVTHDELVAAGHLVLPEVVAVSTGCAPAAGDHTGLVSALIADENRNQLIVHLAADEAHQGRTVLVLSARVVHCRQLAAMLNEAGVDACALTGAVPKGKRTEILERFRSGTLPVVCATALADEGLDVPALSRLILATPARAEGRTIQRLGRLMRPHPGKEKPVLFDLVDDSPIARSQYTARKRAYRRVLEGHCDTASARAEE